MAALLLSTSIALASIKFPMVTGFFPHALVEFVAQVRIIVPLFLVNNVSRAFFGDVISFDTTYLTKSYNMPFASFVGDEEAHYVVMAKKKTPTYFTGALHFLQMLYLDRVVAEERHVPRVPPRVNG
ncbi:protein FAR1-RELATED SEQUENCE 5-like protein [Corchorus capsularis]|uniref:Protein FAR1-RELATED SEQUENCE 5-like protein n=1 Tax=Corchorus capsularis TaxID=210143 RepID=A0A1R3JIE8_COCAP|nr:protein FAR1-RELATED SEQUENCE 5-like protein [Corchorus capsularis]